MAKRLVSSVVVLWSLLAMPGRPAHRILCEGFLPENDMRIPVDYVGAKGIDETMFNSVLDRVEEVYRPIISQQGGNLVVNRLWKNPKVNASAEQNGRNWIITMYGGLARHKDITPDGFALVACHELGHHVGGYPKINGDDWASNEGEADYYSTLKCLRRVLEGTSPADLDPTAKTGCESRYQGVDLRHCEQDAMGGISAARLLAGLSGSPAPSFSTPDRSVVQRTDDDHPAAQCRLDTFYQGALCTKNVDEELSDKAPAPGACTTAAGYKDGVRPLCWFKPPTKESAPVVASSPAPLMPEAKTFQDRLNAMRGAFSDRSL